MTNSNMTNSPAVPTLPRAAAPSLLPAARLAPLDQHCDRTRQALQPLLGRLLDSVHSGILVADARQPGMPILYANARVEAITGYSADELLGRSCAMLQSGDSRQPGLQDLRDALRQGQPCHVLLRNYHRSGRMFLNDLRLTPLLGEDGRPDYYVGVQTDVTENRLEQERALEMLDRIDESFIALDRFWRVTYANPQALQLLGRAAVRALQGHTLWDLLPSALNGETKSHLEAVLRDQQSTAFTDYFPEVAAWIEARAFPVTDGMTVYFRNVSQRKEHEARLEYQARHDLLTGLLNRRSFVIELTRRLQESGARWAELAIVMVNVDGFGKINESLGADLGNTFLQALSRRLVAQPLAVQTAARSGSDEFLLLLSVPPAADLQRMAASLQDLLCAPIEAAGLSLAPSVTLGISPVVATAASSSASLHGEAENLLVYAAAAVREARKGGPGRIQIFDDSLQRQAVRRQELLLALQAKDLLDQLHLVYQPQLRLADGACIGLEALLRWTHPVLGMVSPGEFIPLMETNGSMIRTGRWVLQAACAQITRWQQQGAVVPTVSINASAIEFLDPDYPARIAAAMQQHGFGQAALAVEVTESLAIGDLALANRQLGALQAAGVQVHLDDFGSGYAHLRSLRGLHADTVKIDRSLVEGLESDDGAVTMLRAIVQLAHGLGRQVLVEGIETAGEARVARELGCDAAQGYFFGRPVRPEAIQLLAAA